MDNNSDHRVTGVGHTQWYTHTSVTPHKCIQLKDITKRLTSVQHSISTSIGWHFSGSHPTACTLPLARLLLWRPCIGRLYVVLRFPFLAPRDLPHVSKFDKCFSFFLCCM